MNRKTVFQVLNTSHISALEGISHEEYIDLGQRANPFVILINRLTYTNNTLLLTLWNIHPIYLYPFEILTKIYI